MKGHGRMRKYWASLLALCVLASRIASSLRGRGFASAMPRGDSSNRFLCSDDPKVKKLHETLTDVNVSAAKAIQTTHLLALRQNCEEEGRINEGGSEDR